MVMVPCVPFSFSILSAVEITPCTSAFAPTAGPPKKSNELPPPPPASNSRQPLILTPAPTCTPPEIQTPPVKARSSNALQSQHDLPLPPPTVARLLPTQLCHVAGFSPQLSPAGVWRAASASASRCCFS